MQRPEPRFSRIAAAMADPSRALMLSALLGGEYRSAGELAAAAGITAQAASTQLATLLDAALVSVRSQGRHKYFCLADSDVAHALEALSLVAERDNVSRRWQRPAYAPLKNCRRCYGHMAGELGVAQFEMLLCMRYLEQSELGLQLSEAGRVWLDSLGIGFESGLKLGAQPLPIDRSTKITNARFAYPCMDWSERRDHLAGTLAKLLLTHYVAKDWLKVQRDSRALVLTPLGQQYLIPVLNTHK